MDRQKLRGVLEMSEHWPMSTVAALMCYYPLLMTSVERNKGMGWVDTSSE